MEKFSIYSYLSLINTKGDWWVSGSEEMYQLVNFLINTGLVLNRWIYQMVDLSLQIFMGNRVFENTIDSVFNIATALYQSLFSTVGVVIFIIALGMIFLIYAFKSPQDSFRKLLTLFLVIGVNFVIYSNGDEYLKDIAGIFGEVEQVMTKAVELPFWENDGSQTKIEAGTDASVKKIREAYFKMTIQQSFSMVNFGTSIHEERFDEFLYTDDQASDQAIKEGLKLLVEAESKINRYMTPDGSLDKWFISVYAWVSNLFIGLPLMLMAGLNFFLKIIVLCLVLALPLLSIISLIPAFSSSLFNLLGRVILIFFVGMFMSLAMYLFFFMMMLIDHSIIAMAGGSSLVSSVLGSFSKAVVIIIVVKYRNQLISFITGRRITYIEQMDKKMLKSLKINQKNVEVLVDRPRELPHYSAEMIQSEHVGMHFREISEMELHLHDEDIQKEYFNEVSLNNKAEFIDQAPVRHEQIVEIQKDDKSSDFMKEINRTNEFHAGDKYMEKAEKNDVSPNLVEADYGQYSEGGLKRLKNSNYIVEEEVALRGDKQRGTIVKSSEEERQMFYQELEELRLE
ncbi:hypothetical protein IW492_06835 [Enterococcus sp. BWB1-3]|uniref:CD3337/EF1877 family mobilome membrane protein n=1 Tax=Enterococcus sp. BWB1-3 TaxID=2787713 RepID=UPI001920D2E2|nr:hypothetical protein [Enterococcus sp. BWB1-3]MBL1228946.1 hypothetical protein [Enterococcus sp. BWB1-3]